MQITTNNQNTSFGYGITKKIAGEISSCDINKVAREFQKNNIHANFNDNKIWAFCSLKCLQIINFINKNYHLNLSLPKAIFVDDFSKLKVDDEDAIGLTTLVPAKLYRNNNTCFPEQTIFFDTNSATDMTQFDFQSDILYFEKFQSSSLFLMPALHEFSHVIHNDNLLNELGVKGYLKRILSQEIPEKYIPTIRENVCEYATASAFEAVACDISKRIAENMDTKRLQITSNPIANSPYRKYKPFEQIARKDEFTKIMHKLWQGNF